MRCNQCGCSGTKESEQTFADGSVHIRMTCADCGRFVKFAPQGIESFKDRSFKLIGKIADATTTNQINECQRIARELMREARGEL